MLHLEVPAGGEELPAELAAPDSPNARAVWAVERCRRLEHQKFGLLKEIETLRGRVTERDAAIARFRAANNDLRDASRESTTALQAARRKLRVQHGLLQELQEANRRLEGDKRRMHKERRAEARMLDSITMQHSALEEQLSTERARHSEAEEGYDTSMEHVKRVMEAEQEALRGEIEEWRRREASLLQQIQQAQEKIVAAQEQLALGAQREAEARKGQQKALTQFDRLKESFAEEVEAVAALKREAEAKLSTVHTTESRLKEALALLGAQESETLALREAVHQLTRQLDETQAALTASKQRLTSVCSERDHLRTALSQGHIRAVDLSVAQAERARLEAQLSKHTAAARAQAEASREASETARERLFAQLGYGKKARRRLQRLRGGGGSQPPPAPAPRMVQWQGGAESVEEKGDG